MCRDKNHSLYTIRTHTVYISFDLFPPITFCRCEIMCRYICGNTKTKFRMSEKSFFNVILIGNLSAKFTIKQLLTAEYLNGRSFYG